jgi:hypothetical protein
MSISTCRGLLMKKLSIDGSVSPTLSCCRVTFKHLPQPHRRHIQSFGTLGQLLKMPPFSSQNYHSDRGRGCPFFRVWKSDPEERGYIRGRVLLYSWKSVVVWQEERGYMARRAVIWCNDFNGHIFGSLAHALCSDQDCLQTLSTFEYTEFRLMSVFQND